VIFNLKRWPGNYNAKYNRKIDLLIQQQTSTYIGSLKELVLVNSLIRSTLDATLR